MEKRESGGGKAGKRRGKVTSLKKQVETKRRKDFYRKGPNMGREKNTKKINKWVGEGEGKG